LITVTLIQIEGRTTKYLHFEASLAVAQAKLKIIPQKAADAIVEKCTIDLIDWDELRRQTELIGYA
jgi:3-carboxy-cis,cis-muconate cycloisomerase